MAVLEIRGTEEVRRFVAQGLWLQRVAPVHAASVGPALRWTLELASAGEPVPPPGFIADAGHLFLDRSGLARGGGSPALDVPSWPAGLVRQYEDLVLGKLDADPTSVRASDALARYRGRDRDRGLAFVVDQSRRRAGFDGVILNPAALKSALEVPPEELLSQGWSTWAGEESHTTWQGLYQGLIHAFREMHELLGPEDLFELEHGTALAAFSQRVALRQVLQSAARFESEAPRDRPRPDARRQDVATRYLDEDAYPVGGFSSISTRGSFESLLHSQLAYIEPSERPDMFDIKYARDELLYYSRDENQFFRRRRTFLIALAPDLVLARVKDPAIPVQRIILLLGALVALVRRLTEWLSEDAIIFEFLFLQPSPTAQEPLAAERGLMEMVLREAIANGTALTEMIGTMQLTQRVQARSRRSLCLTLVVSSAPCEFAIESDGALHLRLDRARPELTDEDGPVTIEATDDLGAWSDIFQRVLRRWA